jgi:hypothetical protein
VWLECQEALAQFEHHCIYYCRDVVVAVIGQSEITPIRGHSSISIKSIASTFAESGVKMLLLKWEIIYVLLYLD